MPFIPNFILFLLLPLSCLADGMVIPSTALPAEVHIPDQRALIHFTNGIERLVIETRFTGSGTNFAWVVPLPSPPVIEEATMGLFPTLQYLFRPRIEHDVPRYFAWLLLAIPVVYFAFFAQRGSSLQLMDAFACLALAAAGLFLADPIIGPLGFLLVFLVLIYGVSRVRNSAWGLLQVLLLALAILIFAGLFLPALSGAGPSSAQTAGVSVIDRKMVGIYETTTIASRDHAALQSWLQTNGYAPPVHGGETIASYVKQDWVFVAAKIRRDDPSLHTATPHPLSFTFKTEKPVYPMRLTGLDSRPVRVELYVFGPSRAEAPHFKVEQCAIPKYPRNPSFDPHTFYIPNPPAFGAESPAISHPLLRKWVDGSPVVTKLTATLTAEDMRDDVWLSWKPFSQVETVLYSDQGAWIRGANWGMGLFALAVVAAALLRLVAGKWPGRFLIRSVAIALIVTGVIYLVLPKIAVRMVRRPGMYAQMNLKEIKRVAEDVITNGETNLSKVRLELGNTVKKWRTPYGENYLSGGPIRDEDSPGNYHLRETTNGFELTTYDANGTPEIDVFPRTPSGK